MKKLFIFSTILFCCCQQNSNLVKENAEIIFSNNDSIIKQKLHGKFVKKVNDSLINPSTPFVHKDYLILREKRSKKMFNVIQIPEEKYLGKYMNIGRGPGEGLSAWRYFNLEDGNLGVYDIKLKKIVEFNIDSLLIKNEFLKEYYLPSSVVVSDGAFKYNSRIYFNNTMGDLRYCLYSVDLEGNDLKGHGKSPMLDNYFFDLKLKLSDIFSVNIDRYKNISVFSYSKIPLWRIFYLDEDKWINIYGPDDYIPSPYDGNYRLKQFYKTIRITEKYIYTLYNGKDRVSGNPFSQNANVVYCFSHEGQLIKKIWLDKGVYSFSIYNDSLLYGLNIGKDNVIKLVKFKL